MSELDLNRLEQYRNEILKAEIGALLFNLGKTHIGFSFWRDYFPHKSSEFKFSSYKEYPENYFYEELGKISSLLKKFFENLEIDLDFFKTNFIELIKAGDSNEDFIQKIFFRGCENINSGIDKGSPNKKLEPPLWLSNAFGSFKEKIKEESFDNSREKFFKELEKLLKENNYFNQPNWQQIRNFIILEEIKDWYSHLLSDSRFPINDVTLFDQAYMTASMFKAVLSQRVMDSSKFSNYKNNPSSIKWRILGIQYDKIGLAEKGFKLASIKWYREIAKEIDEEIKKLLEVEYPIGNEIYRDETGIYFIVGENVGEDLDNGSNLAKLNDGLIEIEQKILEIFKDKTDDEFYPVIFLTKASRGLMNLSNLLESAKENFLKTNWKKKNKDLYIVRTEYGSAIGICPICQTRLIYEKDKEKNNSPTICEICDNRIHHNQVSFWIDNIGGETIWTEEVKDKNNRVAYISLKFELKEWLSGDLLNSLLVRNEDYKKYLSEIRKFILLLLSKSYNLKVDISNINDEINKIKQFLKDSSFSKDKKRELGQKKSQLETQKRKIETFLKLIQEIKNNNWWGNKINTKYSFSGYTNKTIDDMIEELNRIVKSINIANLGEINNPFQGLSPDAYNGCKINYETFDDFIQQIFFSSMIGTKWEDWIKRTPLNSKIKWEEEKIKWEEFTDENDPALDLLATLLLQFLLRKNPSPARLRRIWETTQEFFEDIHNDLDEILKMPEWRKKRLVWEVDYTDKIKATGEELEGDGLLFWAQSSEDRSKIKVYLITSIEDFIEKFGDETLKEEINGKDKDIDKEKIKIFLGENFRIDLKRFFEDKNKSEGKTIITLTKDNLSEIHSYKPYSLITDISPINYQIIIPAEYLSNFIDEVLRKYNKEFKYVYGKLPIHIGIVVSNYKKPLYVNLKALRKIRRDIKETEKLWINEDTGKFCQLQKEKLSYATIEEKVNNTESYYSLYFDNPNNQNYNFYIKPNNNWKYWISTLDKFPLNSKVKIIPNTFDFEFMDANTRRNDIYYDENNHYKRALEIKSNRPYELEVYWGKFKIFYDLFKDKNNTAKMHKLVGLFYDKLQNYDERYKPLLASAIINILELKKNEEAKRYISQIFDLDEEYPNFQKEISEKLNEEKLKLFIDMFEFWHTALKEV